MNYLDQFTIPVKGLHAGQHDFHFQISNDFFAYFESQLIESGDFLVNVGLIKNPDMLILQVSYNGHWDTTCDRCMAEIKAPVSGQNTTLIKYGNQESDEGDIIYILSGTPELNIAQIIYEHILTGLPFRKTCDDVTGEEDSCDPAILEKLVYHHPHEPETNDTWSALSGLKLEEE